MEPANFIERLSQKLELLSDNLNADAAVTLLIKIENQGFKIFFVKRVESPRDIWSGQMALPGGKRDPQDRSLKQTAVRETLEETNIDLLHRCRFLGVMDRLASTQRPEMKILPFVVLLQHEPSIKLNEELEWFMWISPEELVHNRGTARFSFGEVSAYVVGKSVIWGLTYRILERFFDLLGYPR